MVDMDVMYGGLFLRNYSAELKPDMVPVYWWLLMNAMPKLGFDLFELLSGILMALRHHLGLIVCHIAL